MMSGPELPYLISSSDEALALLRKSSEEALALLRKITKRIDDFCKRFDNLCDNLCFRLDKPTSRKIFASSDLATDLSSRLDYGVSIAPGFRGPSNHYPHISRL